MERYKKNVLLAGLLFAMAATVNAGHDNAAVGSTLHKKEKVALSDVPKSVTSVILSANPQFVMKEAEKELKHGNTYYDVEGLDANGNEIEFDMLLGSDGSWSIAEIQRDLHLEQCPDAVIKLYQEKVGVVPARIIESDQGGGVVVYEFYTREAGKEKKYEIKLSVELLEKEWTH